MSTGYSWEGLRQVCAMLLGAHHVPEHLCCGSVYLEHYNKCLTFTITFIGVGFTGEGVSNKSGVIENGDFYFFRLLYLSNLHTLYIELCSPLVALL